VVRVGGRRKKTRRPVVSLTKSWFVRKEGRCGGATKKSQIEMIHRILGKNPDLATPTQKFPEVRTIKYEAGRVCARGLSFAFK